MPWTGYASSLQISDKDSNVVCFKGVGTCQDRFFPTRVSEKPNLAAVALDIIGASPVFGLALDTSRNAAIAMKSTHVIVVAALTAAIVTSGDARAAECEGKPSETRLSVDVMAVRAARGEVAITIYPDDARRFLAPGRKLLRVRAPARAPKTTACFFLPAPGFYAAAVYHDANGDQDFNRTLIGMPAEDFGFSNDAPTPFGLPAFKTVRFQARQGETKITIRLRPPP